MRKELVRRRGKALSFCMTMLLGMLSTVSPPMCSVQAAIIDSAEANYAEVDIVDYENSIMDQYSIYHIYAQGEDSCKEWDAGQKAWTEKPLDNLSDQGITFDAKSNTLMLDHCDQPAWLVEYTGSSASANAVSNFYIHVEGECRLKGIIVSVDNLVITGDGVLEVNAPTDIAIPADDTKAAINMRSAYSGASDSNLYVSNSVTLKLHRDSDKEDSGAVLYSNRHDSEKELYLSYEGAISAKPSWKQEVNDNSDTSNEMIGNLNVLQYVPAERIYKLKSDSSDNQIYVLTDNESYDNDENSYPYYMYSLLKIEQSYYTYLDSSDSYSAPLSVTDLSGGYTATLPEGLVETDKRVGVYLPVCDPGDAPLHCTKWTKNGTEDVYVLLAKKDLIDSSVKASNSALDSLNSSYLYCVGRVNHVYNDEWANGAYYVSDLEDVAVNVSDHVFDYSAEDWQTAENAAKTDLTAWMKNQGFEAAMHTQDNPDTYTFYVLNDSLTFSPNPKYGTEEAEGVSAHINTEDPYDPDGHLKMGKRILSARTKTKDATAIYSNGVLNSDTGIDGVTYDAATNTATLTNAHLVSLQGSFLGTDFKLKLVGENTVDGIDMLNSSLAITGTGSLMVNADKVNDSAIVITEENGEAGSFTVEDGLSLYLYAKEGHNVVELVNTSTAQNGVVLPSADVDIEKKDGDIYSDTNPFYVHYLPYPSTGIVFPTYRLIRCYWKGDTSHTLYGALGFGGTDGATTYQLYLLTYIPTEGIYHAKRVTVDGKLQIDEDTLNQYFAVGGTETEERAYCVADPHAGRLCEDRVGNIYAYTIITENVTQPSYIVYDLYKYREVENGYYFGKDNVINGVSEEEFLSQYKIIADEVPCYSYAVKGTELQIGHIHIYDTAWENDTEYHWHACTAKDEVVSEKAKHEWNSGEVTTPATETAEGVKTFTCTVCGATKTEKFDKLQPVTPEQPQVEPVHTHTESGWQSDKDGHWKICKDCGEVIVSKVPHIKGEGSVKKAATEAEVGEIVYQCTECGYSWSEEIAKLQPKTDETQQPEKDTTEQTKSEIPETTEQPKQETPATTEQSKQEIPETTEQSKQETPTTAEQPTTEAFAAITEGITTEDASGATYTVTSSASEVVEVEYTSASDSTEKKVAIPSTVTVNGVEATVTSIADNAFSGNTTITTVSIPSTVEEIGQSAFENCTKLTTVTIPRNVEEVGKNAFAGCTSLTKVTVKGNSLTKVDQGAFKNCKKLTNITLPKTVTSIGKEAFSGDKKLKTITIKSTKLKTVGKNAFKNVPSSTTIKVPAKQKKAYTKLLKKAGFKGKIK